MPPSFTEEDTKHYEMRMKNYFAERSGKKKPNPVDAEQSPLSRYFKEYFMYIEARQEKTTVDDKRIYLPYVYKNLCQLLNTKYITFIELTDNLFMAYQIERQRSVSNRAINKELGYFFSYLKYVRKTRDIIYEPSVEPLKARSKLVTVPTREEFDQMLEHSSGSFRAFIATLYFPGLRFSEAARLKWGDIDFENDLIFVRKAKGGEPKTAYLHPRLKEELKAYMPEKPKQSAYVFPSPYNPDKPITDVRGSMQATLEKAGIKKNITFHALRHACGTHLAMSGAQHSEIQRYLGHAQASTTDRYIRMAALELKKISEKL